MRKLIIKTALITFSVSLILAISIFGIVSFCAPTAMVNLTASMGLEGISGDYAYQEYQRSGSIEYLARSFEIASRQGNREQARIRFEALISHKEFDAYCAEQDGTVEGTAISYRDFIFGSGAVVKYKLSQTDEEKKNVYQFALEHTEKSFPKGNPVIMLAIEAAEDKDFALYLLEELPTAGFEENEDYRYINSILKEAAGK